MNNYFVEQYYITKMIQNPVLSFMTIDVKIKELLKNYNINCDEQTYKNLENNIIKNKEKRKYTDVFLKAIKKFNPKKEIIKNIPFPTGNRMYYFHNGELKNDENTLSNVFKNFSTYQINYLLEKKLLSNNDKNLLIDVLLRDNELTDYEKIFKKLKEDKFIISDMKVYVLIILNSLKEKVSEEELQTEKYKKEELDKFNKKIDLLTILMDDPSNIHNTIMKILSLNNIQELIEEQDEKRNIHFKKMLKTMYYMGGKQYHGREFIIDFIKIDLEHKILQKHINTDIKKNIATNKKKSSRL